MTELLTDAPEEITNNMCHLYVTTDELTRILLWHAMLVHDYAAYKAGTITSEDRKLAGVLSATLAHVLERDDEQLTDHA